MGAHSVLFEIGFVVRAPEAMLLLVLAQLTESSLIARHEQGDFGDVGVDQCLCNMYAIGEGRGVVRSLYRFPTGCVCVETDLRAGETRMYLSRDRHTAAALVAAPGVER